MGVETSKVGFPSASHHGMDEPHAATAESAWKGLYRVGGAAALITKFHLRLALECLHEPEYPPRAADVVAPPAGLAPVDRHRVSDPDPALPRRKGRLREIGESTVPAGGGMAFTGAMLR